MMSATMTNERRKARIRSRITGTPERPRLAVSISNKHIVAQVIDDTAGKTLAYASTIGSEAKGTLAEKAAWVGEQVAAGAKKHKITRVTFDRGGRVYRKRLNALAEAARQKGLEF